MGLMIVAVTLALLLTGWQAFNPGPLTALAGRNVSLGGYASHAEFERQCGLCHQPLGQTMSELCQDCHTNVRAQIEGQSGLHGKVNPSTRCADCHPDHVGREFAIGQAALPYFDALSMHFSQVHHAVDYAGAPMECTGCHNVDDPSYAPAVDLCRDCHAANDVDGMRQHDAAYGTACLDCHDGEDRMSDLDHASTGFALEAKHADLACVACHVGEREQGAQMFAGLSTTCVDCHENPVLHAGYFGDRCEECHAPSGWLTVRWKDQYFNHTFTGFNLARHALDYAGAAITCKSCHPESLGGFDAQACIDCHRAESLIWLDSHQMIKGKDCIGCHDGVDRMATFNHDLYYPLEGRHLEALCVACHAAGEAEETYAGLPSQCKDCHPEPELHAGVFGVECQHCHDATAWSPAYLRDHLFPFDHGGARLTDCRLCHKSSYMGYSCYGCHDHQAAEIEILHRKVNITGEELRTCMDCHPDGKWHGDD